MYQTREEYRKAWHDTALGVDPPVPLNVDLELCSICALRCPFCYWGESKFQEDMKSLDHDGKPLKRQMPTELAMRLIDEAVAIGVPAMKFHGRGDGIHHKDYSKIILYAREKGGDKLEILLNTHGMATPDKIDGLMAADKVMISLDATVPSRYEQMRVGGRFSNAVWTVHELLRRGHANVWVRRVITRENRDEPFVENCKRIFGPQVHVSEHFAFPGRNEAYLDAGSEPKDWPRKFCQYPSVRAMVTASGLVLPCCVDWRQEMVMGDVNKQSILEIWNGEPFRNLRAELRANQFKSKICASCTSFAAYSRPESDWVQDREGRAAL